MNNIPPLFTVAIYAVLHIMKLYLFNFLCLNHFSLLYSGEYGFHKPITVCIVLFLICLLLFYVNILLLLTFPS